MSEHGLTPEALKEQHVAEITELKTFRTQGVNEHEALDYLETQEGTIYLQHLRDAAPNTSKDIILNRAFEHITSGRDLPRMVTIGPDDPLVKAVPRDEMPTPYTPFFGRRPEFERTLAEGHAINDRFGLPVKSEAPVYDLFEARPRESTRVFVSTVARTSDSAER